MDGSSERTEYVISHISSVVKTFLKKHQDQATRDRVKEAFEIICRTPLHYQKRIRPIKGKHKGEYRYRFGGIRIHYFVNQADRTIQILNIEKRGDIAY